MDIKFTQGSFKSSNGENALSYYIHTPENIDIQGIIQISHGMCEYFLRYTDFIAFMCSKGFIVCGYDHLGHGSSVTLDSKLGFFSLKNGYQHLAYDMLHFSDMISNKYPDLPLFMFAHSMGSLVCRYAISLNASKYKGVILSGTANSKIYLNPAISLIKYIISTKGPLHKSILLDKLMFVPLNARINNRLTNSDWICTDQDVVLDFITDEKCNFKFTASAFLDLLTIAKICNLNYTFMQTRSDLPIYLMSGQEDAVGDYGKGVIEVYKKYKKFGAKNINIKLYSGYRHEMVNEPIKNTVYEDIYSWIINTL